MSRHAQRGRPCVSLRWQGHSGTKAPELRPRHHHERKCWRAPPRASTRGQRRLISALGFGHDAGQGVYTRLYSMFIACNVRPAGQGGTLRLLCRFGALACGAVSVGPFGNLCPEVARAESWAPHSGARGGGGVPVHDRPSVSSRICAIAPPLLVLASQAHCRPPAQPGAISVQAGGRERLCSGGSRNG